jgi:hypothetical protein
MSNLKKFRYLIELYLNLKKPLGKDIHSFSKMDKEMFDKVQYEKK